MNTWHQVDRCKPWLVRPNFFFFLFILHSAISLANFLSLPRASLPEEASLRLAPNSPVPSLTSFTLHPSALIERNPSDKFQLFSAFKRLHKVCRTSHAAQSRSALCFYYSMIEKDPLNLKWNLQFNVRMWKSWISYKLFSILHEPAITHIGSVLRRLNAPKMKFGSQFKEESVAQWGPRKSSVYPMIRKQLTGM